MNVTEKNYDVEKYVLPRFENGKTLASDYYYK